MVPGDRIVSVNDLPTPALQDVQEVLAGTKGETVYAGIIRDQTVLTIPLRVNEEGLVMVGIVNPVELVPVTVKQYSFLKAFPAGIKKAYETGANYIRELGLIFTPKTQAYKSVGSFIAIGSIFPGTWNWEIFWNITAWLSIMLAILNLLPIPALDGGHIVLVLYEMVKRKPSENFWVFPDRRDGPSDRTHVPCLRE